MRALFGLLLMLSVSSAFAGDLTPKSFGVNFFPPTKTTAAMIDFMFTVNGSDLPKQFSTLSATIVDVNDPNVIIAPAQVVYSKGPDVVIISEILHFSFVKQQASIVISALNRSKIIFTADDGSSFSINLANLCVSNPSSFLNLSGGPGCPK